MTETSTKPYLIRALHEWCTDNGYTPYITVVVDENTVVPREHVRDGAITLNIGALATHKLLMGNEFIEFQARFGGVSRQISVPVGAVRAIYARETGQGMAFEVTPPAEPAPAPAGAGAPEAAPQESDERPALSSVPDAEHSPDGPPEEPPPAGPADGGSRPKLKVIK